MYTSVHFNVYRYICSDLFNFWFQFICFSVFCIMKQTTYIRVCNGFVSCHYNIEVVNVHYLLIDLSNCLCYAPGSNSWREQIAEAAKIVTLTFLKHFTCSDGLAQKACSCNHGQECTKIHRACLITETTEGFSFFWSFTLLFQAVLCEPLKAASLCVPLPHGAGECLSHENKVS